ncbi:Glyoxalase-like domain-containing protein [Micromonospora zamorensis]|nr:Glyoxalase-like domain-containing protein [Micromonospora zamorensis]
MLPRMHRSRVYALLIDAPAAEATRAAEFWSAALGVSTRSHPAEPQFVGLHEALPGLVAAVQAVDDEPRFHLDIETDDVPAETARLIGLGATEVSQWLECRILRAPGGHLLCVLPVESPPELFAAEARTWS